MTYDVRPDPFMLKVWALEQSDDPPLGRPMREPGDSHHIWSARLPDDLPPGAHTIEVEWTDMYGRSYHGTRIIRVE